jgi:DNA-binding IclR family transcriptional regulator
MKRSTPAKPTSGAPALTRGLAILQTVGQDGPLSLEQIAKQLKLPKASAYRLLETLDEAGMIRKSADKRYEALQQLRLIQSPRERLRDQIESRMHRLAQDTVCTVEWYEPTVDGMQLVLQQNPETELCVKARPGFLRDWQTEFEAVTRLGHAFANQAPEIKQSQLYTANGHLSPINRKAIQKGIQEAKASRNAHDTAFNSNGVRRSAVAAFDSPEHFFLGVLALAEVYHFSRTISAEFRLGQLMSILQS